MFWLTADRTDRIYRELCGSAVTSDEFKCKKKKKEKKKGRESSSECQKYSAPHAGRPEGRMSRICRFVNTTLEVGTLLPGRDDTVKYRLQKYSERTHRLTHTQTPPHAGSGL